MFFLQELHLLQVNTHFFKENLICAKQRQIKSTLGITKFFANLKQKMQILSVLIAHANTILIAQSAKYGSTKCKIV